MSALSEPVPNPVSTEQELPQAELWLRGVRHAEGSGTSPSPCPGISLLHHHHQHVRVSAQAENSILEDIQKPGTCYWMVMSPENP